MKGKSCMALGAAMLFCLCLFAACGGGEGAESRSGDEGITRLSAEGVELLPEDMRNTGFGLLQLFLSGSEEDMVFSPYSLDFALGLLANGADPAAQQDICHLVGAADLDELNGMLSQRMQAAENHNSRSTEDNAVRLAVANGLFVAEGYDLSEVYGNRVVPYRAELTSVDFAQPESVDQINDWVRGRTQGMIPRIVEGFTDPQMTRLVAVNALYFKGGWQQDFYQLRQETFHGLRGDGECTFMTRGGLTYGYYQDASIQFVTVPFKSGGFRMFFGLPTEDSPAALTKLTEGITPEKWTTMLSGGGDAAAKYFLTLHAPQFRIESTADRLQDSLVALGLNLEQATFDAMLEEPGTELVLSQLVQRVMIDVDEKGVEAAAVTLAQADAEAALEEEEPEYYEMTLDRPFFYGILDGDDNLLFLGALRNPPA